MKIIRRKGNRPVRPVIQANDVLISPYSAVYVEKGNFIAVDYLNYRLPSPFGWYFFVSGEQVKWGSLSNDQRLTFRVVVLRRELGEHTAWYSSPGGYEDERYYTLEALVECSTDR